MRGAALVILAWNQWSLTRRCLDSLLASTLDFAEIIVVDNGSTDATPYALAEYADRVRIVRLPDNLGFVQGMNAGIVAARPDDDVVLLNNDLVFEQADWLGRLRDAAYAAPDHGIVGCRLLGAEPERLLNHVGGFIEPDELWGQQTESGIAERDVAQYTRLRRVESIAFALAYIRRDCLDRVGKLDAVFHSYFEDTDYCSRARDLGIATVVAGAVTLSHLQHGSTRDDGGFRARIAAASKTTFAARWQQRLADEYRATFLWRGTTRSSPPHAMLARALVRRLDARGLRATYRSVIDEPLDAQDYRLDLAARRDATTPEIGIACAPGAPFAALEGRLRVALAFGAWERVPAEWTERANALDRLIVPDAFQSEAFRSAGVRVPIDIVPLGVDRDYCHVAVPPLRDGGGRFVFLAVVEERERDGVNLLIETFRRTFAREEQVDLLLYVPKSPASDAFEDALDAELADNDGGSVRVLMRWNVAFHQSAALVASCDAFVSAQRGGHWSPWPGIALALGRPTIAPAFGSIGSLVAEFGTPIAIARRVDDPRHPGGRWVEPDRDALAVALRRAFEAREDRSTSARAATFAESHNIDATADALDSLVTHYASLARRARTPRAHRPSDASRGPSRQIVVLGMHRSGTSTVAGLLARLGAWPGEDGVLLRGPDNPRGHYEHGALHMACVHRLAAAGGDWKSPPPSAPPSAIDAFRRDVAAVIESLEPHGTWLLKEPRLCLLARELLSLLTRPVFVHVARDPLEAAASLAERDGMAIDDALALWERYTADAFAASRGYSRLIVDYAELLADPIGATQRLLAALEAAGVVGLVMPSDAVVLDWIAPNDRRLRGARETDRLTHSQRELLAAIADRSILDVR